MRNVTTHTTRRVIMPVFVSAVILCAIILFGLSARMPMVSAASTPQILLSPSSAGISVGQTFTMTVNLTGFSNPLYLYQVVFEYNGTILNLTNVLFPTGYVFSGQTNTVPVWSTGGDVVNGLNYTVAGNSLTGTESVPVSSNCLLFEATFTGLAAGQATINVCAQSSPATGPNQSTWYTFVQDPPGNKYVSFATTTSTVTVPEFTPILLLMMLPMLGIAILITRKKLARQA